MRKNKTKKLRSYLRRICRYRFIIVSSWSDGSRGAEVMSGEENVPAPADRVHFLFQPADPNIEVSLRQQLLPNSPNDTPFEK